MVKSASPAALCQIGETLGQVLCEWVSGLKDLQLVRCCDACNVMACRKPIFLGSREDVQRIEALYAGR